MTNALARLLVFSGIVLVAVGGFVWALGRFVNLGHLPLDFRFQRDRASVFIPIGTSILLSIVLTVVLNLLLRLRR